MFAASYFCELAFFFCILRELTFAIVTDWFFLLGTNFCHCQRLACFSCWVLYFLRFSRSRVKLNYNIFAFLIKLHAALNNTQRCKKSNSAISVSGNIPFAIHKSLNFIMFLKTAIHHRFILMLQEKILIEKHL